MSFRAYLIFFLLFGLVPDLYIGCVYTPGSALLWKGMVCLPTLAALVSLVLIGLGKAYTESLRLFSYLIFLFELPKFVFMLLSPLGVAGMVAGASVSLFFGFLIFYSSRHLKLHRETLAFEGLPAAFDGLRICQLTDLHLGSFGRKAGYVTRIVDSALALQPDLILFTGAPLRLPSMPSDADQTLWLKEQTSRIQEAVSTLEDIVNQ